MQTTATSYSINIQEIRNITGLSTNTAMTLFKSAIAPIITYEIDIIWEHLTIGKLIRIEKVKAIYMNGVSEVERTAPSRLAYKLLRKTYFVKDIRMQHHQLTSPYQEFMKTKDRKRNETDLEFYSTSVMSEKIWKQECQDWPCMAFIIKYV